MTRIALLTLSLSVFPLMAVAQTPPPPPAAPLPVPAPDPAPRAVPLPPLPPMPPTPVISGSIHLGDLDVHLPESLNHILIESQIDVARIEAEVARATADITRQAGVLARQAADQARNINFNFGGDAYNSGLNALQQRQYDRALQAFDKVIADKGARVDAALYWKAFTEFRLARTDAAIRTLAQLRRDHSQSRYLNDARVLETEVKKQTGQSVDPASLDNDEIKLLAIQGLQRTEQVVPLLEGVLNAANSLNVKKRALYVLALGTDPRAREVLMRYARGGGNPDLQIEAIRLLVSRRDPQTNGAVLRELYESSQDSAVKRAVIEAYGALRNRSSGPQVAGSNAAGGLQAGTAPQELMALYQKETDAGLRRQIAAVLVSIGGVDQAIALAKSESDPRVRQNIISMMGGRRSEGSAAALVDLYRSSPDADTREGVINALSGQQNAEALIGLARAETDVKLKTRIVRALSDMAQRSKAAADFLMDVIK